MEETAWPKRTAKFAVLALGITLLWLVDWRAAVGVVLVITSHNLEMHSP